MYLRQQIKPIFYCQTNFIKLQSKNNQFVTVYKIYLIKRIGTTNLGINLRSFICIGVLLFCCFPLVVDFFTSGFSLFSFHRLMTIEQRNTFSFYPMHILLGVIIISYTGVVEHLK